MRGAESPAPQSFACGFELRLARGRNLHVDHLALVIYQQAHMDYISRMRVLRLSHHLGWFDLAQKVSFCLPRRQICPPVMQGEFQFHRSNEPRRPRGRGQRMVDPPARRFQG